MLFGHHRERIQELRCRHLLVSHGLERTLRPVDCLGDLRLFAWQPIHVDGEVAFRVARYDVHDLHLHRDMRGDQVVDFFRHLAMSARKFVERDKFVDSSCAVCFRHVGDGCCQRCPMLGCIGKLRLELFDPGGLVLDGVVPVDSNGHDK